MPTEPPKQHNDLKFGVVLAPSLALGENPGLTLPRSIELIEHLDELGYDYAWIHERPPLENETIGSPDLFVASVVHRTKRIVLGTIVTSLPHHQPLVLAERIMQLDHLIPGRIELAVDAVVPTSAALMANVAPASWREMLLEAIEVLIPLLEGGTVSRKTSWFELDQASLTLSPDTKPMVPMSIAAQVSPAGARIAGRYGLGLISLAATSPGGFNALQATGEIYERKARENSQATNCSCWSLAGPMHIAETRERAIKNVHHGLASWIKYFNNVVGLPVSPLGDTTDIARRLIDDGLAVIGSPADAVDQIRRLQEQSGGFSCFLQMAHDWADWPQTKLSYQLFAQEVAPVFASRKHNHPQSEFEKSL